MTTTMSRYPVEAAAEILAEHGGRIPFGPRTHPCVCGGPLPAHAGPTNGGACKATGCKRYRADLVWQLACDAYDAQQRSLGQSLRLADQKAGEARRRANPVLPGQWRIGVSDTDTCPRSIQYRNKPPADMVLAWEDKREALMGTIIHEGAEARMRTIYPWRLFEHPIDVPGLDRQSRLDWYDQVVRELGDTKTAGDWRWDKIGDEGPDEATWTKVHIYAFAAVKAGLPVDTVRLDYLKRCNGHDETFVQEYDESKARAGLDILTGYATMLDLDIDLPKTGTGPSTDALCARCPFRIHCWNMDAAEALGRSPESYTVLGPDPDDEDIEWAIREKYEASQVRLTAEKVEKEKKILLEGIEPGRYGEMEGYEQGGGGAVDWKGYAERVVENYDKPDGERTPLEHITQPRQPRHTSIRWGKVRKATLDKEKKAEKERAKALAAAEAQQTAESA